MCTEKVWSIKGKEIPNELLLNTPNSWLKTMSSEASQALSWPGWSGEGETYSRAREKAAAAVNPEEVIRRPVTSLVQRSYKPPTGMMSYFTCHHSSRPHTEGPQNYISYLVSLPLLLLKGIIHDSPLKNTLTLYSPYNRKLHKLIQQQCNIM